ncbi:MAG: hypothetical protein HOE45_11525 [Gammaproteobacteria bacterium]|jgi:hypothetical protein|nr:hypothetical protein [Gammaproteobacteria bacterium]
MSHWRDWKFFKWGLFGNTWAWFHIAGGAVGAKIAQCFLDEANTLLVMFGLVILWEVFEFILDGGIEGMKKIYGSLERWFYDSLGDVVGAMLMAIVVVL